jgi:hypothetical protein
MLGISDPYTAYCFDEACAFIVAKMENGEEPQFGRKVKSFTELYKLYK